jgi:hypothetical protein
LIETFLVYSANSIFQKPPSQTQQKKKTCPKNRNLVVAFLVGEVPEGGLHLDLGNVSVMAKVKINGQYARGVWAMPYRVNVSPFVKPGKNEIEIEVVNTWVTRIIGDRKCPVCSVP